MISWNHPRGVHGILKWKKSSNPPGSTWYFSWGAGFIQKEVEFHNSGECNQNCFVKGWSINQIFGWDFLASLTKMPKGGEMLSNLIYADRSRNLQKGLVFDLLRNSDFSKPRWNWFHAQIGHAPKDTRLSPTIYTSPILSYLQKPIDLRARAGSTPQIPKRWAASCWAFTRKSWQWYSPNFFLRQEDILQKKTFLVQSKPEDSELFGARFGGWILSKQAPLPREQSNCKSNAGNFSTWRHRSDPESTSFCRAFYHDPIFFFSFSPLRFFLTSIGSRVLAPFLRMAPMVSKDSPHRHEMVLRWEFVWGQRNAGEKWHRIKTQWSST